MSCSSIQFLTSAAVAVLASAQPASALTIVLTNDDGWDAPGIQALKAALAEEHTVILVAPLDQRSGSSAGFPDEDDISGPLGTPTGERPTISVSRCYWVSIVTRVPSSATTICPSNTAAMGASNSDCA